ELLAFLGPFGMWTALGCAARLPESAPKREPGRKIARGPSPASQIAGVAQTAASPAPAKKPRKIKSAVAARVGDVREWFRSRTAARPGSAARVNECYAAYVEWCKAANLEAVSLTKFGTVMKGELGVEYIEKSKRGYYDGIVLKGGLKVVAG